MYGERTICLLWQICIWESMESSYVADNWAKSRITVDHLNDEHFCNVMLHIDRTCDVCVHLHSTLAMDRWFIWSILACVWICLSVYVLRVTNGTCLVSNERLISNSDFWIYICNNKWMLPYILYIYTINIIYYSEFICAIPYIYKKIINNNVHRLCEREINLIGLEKSVLSKVHTWFEKSSDWFELSFGIDVQRIGRSYQSLRSFLSVHSQKDGQISREKTF